MTTDTRLRSIKSLVGDIGIEGHSLLSINDLSNEQIYGLFHLARVLEPWNRSRIDLCPSSVMATLFFQPSTRTRMSFETAMHRLGGSVLTETTPLISSSSAKEESLGDMITCVSKYANVIVLRHFDEVEALAAAKRAGSPVINGGMGHWEHPTQALLDLYTLWRTYDRIEGLNVCIASADLVEARTGHSMAYGLARLGANVICASPKDRRIPEAVLADIHDATGVELEQVFGCDQDSFNELIRGMDLVYLPGCSAPKGPDAEAFKAVMDHYFVRYETIAQAQTDGGRTIHVTHTLPRRAGEMDDRLDATPSQLYFEAIGYSVSLRMALVASIVGA